MPPWLQRRERRLSAAVGAGACIAVVTAAASYAWNYSRSTCATQLYFKPGALGKLVVESCPLLMSVYKPSPVAFSGHVQTLVTILRQFVLLGHYTREVRYMRDGGCVALDWWAGRHAAQRQQDSRTPILLVLHGLSDSVGGSAEGYVKWMCRSAQERGYRPVVMVYRGCGGLTLTTPRCYNAVDTDDVHEVVHSLRTSYPEAPLCAVGFSLGALILTKYLAEAAALRSKALDLSAARLDEREAEEQRCNGNAERSDSAEADGFGGSSPQPASANGEAAAAEAPSRFENGSDASGRGGANGAAALPAHGSDANGHRSTNGAAAPPADGLTAAAVVANPFDMAVAAKNVSRPWTLGWIYNFVLTFRLRQYMRRHRAQLELLPHFDRAQVAKAMLLHDFDAAATCKLGGYVDSAAYYAAGNSAAYIPRIRVPTLFLVSEDDPFLGTLPLAECRDNERTVLAVTAAGGHCAHLQGWWPLGRSWGDDAVLEFLDVVKAPRPPGAPVAFEAPE